ncbi:hypothetical protein WJ32_12885 [Burkholderia ubonensis]|uniref:Uncharacterized protein n=1 Tax=Burkholderia ubonensis TaxID=101571 RepID=A0A118HUL6_9BURK|nr:hypothetical protein WJ32_12885 [Burkholderia ubonensis]KVG68570.1 hypothetical protein WJ33_03110 [Burkholderia ubonensis]
MLRLIEAVAFINNATWESDPLDLKDCLRLQCRFVWVVQVAVGLNEITTGSRADLDRYFRNLNDLELPGRTDLLWEIRTDGEAMAFVLEAVRERTRAGIAVRSCICLVIQRNCVSVGRDAG